MEENPNITGAEPEMTAVDNAVEEAPVHTGEPAALTDSDSSGLAADTSDVKEPDKDVYIYDADDDEPVDDKDLYRDYTGEVMIVRRPVPTKPAAQKPVEQKPVRNHVQTVHREPPPSSRKSPTGEETVHKSEKSEQLRSEPRSVTVYREGSDMRINRIYTINTVISMITLCAVAAGIFIGYAYLKRLEQDLGISKRRISDLEDSSNAVTAEKSNNGDDEEDNDYIDAISLIDEEELNEPAVPESEIEIENGKLLLYDSYVGYSWTPVLSGIKPHTYNKDNFHVDDDFRMEYVVDGEVSSYFGIDVSSHNGDIDWDAVRSDGVEFAILRIGVRGYGAEGNIKFDDKFIQNYDGARKAGIDIGVYFYSQAISVEEAVEEAKFVLEKLDGRSLEYPVVFDWEPAEIMAGDDPPRTEDVMPGTLTLSAMAFCETIRDAGYEAMLYTNKKMAYIKYDMRKLQDYPVWLALYNTDLTYYYDFDMWQYGFGRVDGVEGDVDLDIAIIR